MFSERVERIRISGIREIFERAKGAINLGLGQPDFDTPPHVKQEAIRAIEEGFTSYTPNAGIQELREAICEKLRRENGIELAPEEILVTSGASEALHLAILSLAERGDEVLMTDPCFVSYPMLTKISDAVPRFAPLREDLTFDPDLLAARITGRTKLVIVNSPSNPTGSVQPSEDMRAIAEIADDYGIFVISDEVYEHFVYEGKHVSPGKFSDNVITVNAPSKTYCMTGWRIGFVAARRDLIERMLRIHSYIQACAPSISQRAYLAALRGPQNFVGEMRDKFLKRRNLVVAKLREHGIDVKGASGAFYVFPKVPDEIKVVNGLLERGVVVVPGSVFGENGRNHIRISYAVGDEDLERAIQIVCEVIDEIRS